MVILKFCIYTCVICSNKFKDTTCFCSTPSHDKELYTLELHGIILFHLFEMSRVLFSLLLFITTQYWSKLRSEDQCFTQFQKILWKRLRFLQMSLLSHFFGDFRSSVLVLSFSLSLFLSLHVNSSC